MSTQLPRVGDRRRTLTGLPVEVVAVRDNDIVLQSLTSGNRFEVPVGYDLRPVGPEMDTLPIKTVAASSEAGEVIAADASRTTANRPLAPIIDALLLEGGQTMKGLAREVRRRASAACQGKDVRANIRARICWLQKRGMKLHRDDAGRVQIRQDMADVGGVPGGGKEVPEAAAGGGAAPDSSGTGGPEGKL